MSNLLAKLLSRETCGRRKHQYATTTSRWYFPSIPARLVIPVESLVGNDQLYNTVFLGFLKDGKHLVGYTAVAGMEEEEGGFMRGVTCRYSLSLWKFDDDTMTKRAPLTKVFECTLFGSDEAPIGISDGILNITVTELNEHNLLCVHGWQRNSDPDDQCDHILSMVSPPVLYNNKGWSDECIVNLRFVSQGMLSDGWEGVYVPGGSRPFVVANTGNSLEYYAVSMRVSKRTGIRKLSLESFKSFDVEKSIQLLVTKNGQENRKCHVIDYDVRMLAVVDNCVLFHLAVLYTEGEITDRLHPSYMRRSTVFSLCPATGLISSVRSVTPVSHAGDPRSFIQIAASQAIFLRNWILAMPPSFEKYTVKLSNASVFSGESLPYLYHPIFPVAICGFELSRRISL